MRNVLVCCGLPRSGTTYFRALLARSLRLGFSSPEETRYLAFPELIRRMSEVLSEVYDLSLVETATDGTRYSAWGRREHFISEMMRALPAVLAALCERDHIEAATIGDEYIREITALRARTLEQVRLGDLLVKQPMAECNWRLIRDAHATARVGFVICLRDPYDVFLSLARLGWYSLAEFLDLAAASYRSSLEILTEGSGFVLSLGMTELRLAETIRRIGAHLGQEDVALPAPDRIAESWRNPRPVDLPIGVPHAEFEAAFAPSEAGRLYHSLRNAAEAVHRPAGDGRQHT